MKDLCSSVELRPLAVNAAMERRSESIIRDRRGVSRGPLYIEAPGCRPGVGSIERPFRERWTRSLRDHRQWTPADFLRVEQCQDLERLNRLCNVEASLA